MNKRPHELQAHTKEGAPSLLETLTSGLVTASLGVLSLVVAWLICCLPLVTAIAFSSGMLGALVVGVVAVLMIEDALDLDLTGKHKLYRRAEDRPERLLVDVDEEGDRRIDGVRTSTLAYQARFTPSRPKYRRALFWSRTRLVLAAAVIGISDLVFWLSGGSILSTSWHFASGSLMLGMVWSLWFCHELIHFGDLRTRILEGKVAHQLLTASGEAHKGDLTLARDANAAAGALSVAHHAQAHDLTLVDGRGE